MFYNYYYLLYPDLDCNMLNLLCCVLLPTVLFVIVFNHMHYFKYYNWNLVLQHTISKYINYSMLIDFFLFFLYMYYAKINDKLNICKCNVKHWFEVDEKIYNAHFVDKYTIKVNNELRPMYKIRTCIRNDQMSVFHVSFNWFVENIQW